MRKKPEELRRASPHLRRLAAPDHLPSEVMVAYTAGFLDGEGYIAAIKRNGRPHFAVSVSQSSLNDGERVLTALRDAWGIGWVQSAGKQPPHAPGYVWVIGAFEHVLFFLRAVVPYLLVKKTKAEEVIAMMTSLPTNPETEYVVGTCRQCGAPVRRRATARPANCKELFCSHPCSIKWHTGRPRLTVTLACAYCGSEFERAKYAARPKTPFCCREHFRAYVASRGVPPDRRPNAARIQIPCAFCGKLIERSPYRISASGRAYCCTEHGKMAYSKAMQSKPPSEPQAVLPRPRPTVCKHGHPLTEENVHVTISGSRICRTCQRERMAECRERKRAV